MNKNKKINGGVGLFLPGLALLIVGLHQREFMQNLVGGVSL